MNESGRKNLAKFLQEKIHEEHLPGYYFNDEDILKLINDYFRVEDLIKQKEEIENEIKKLTR